MASKDKKMPKSADKSQQSNKAPKPPKNDDQLSGLEEQLRAVTEELEQCKNQMQQAEEALKSAQEQKDVEKAELHHTIEDLKHQIEKQKAAVEATSLAQIELQKEKEQMANQLEKASKEFELELQTSLTSLKVQLNDSNARRNELETSLLSVQHELASVKAQKDAEVAMQLVTIQRLEQECELLKKESEKREMELTGSVGGNDILKLMQHNKMLIEQTKAAQKECNEYKKQAADVADKYRTLQLDCKKSASLEKAAVEQCNRQAQAVTQSKATVLNLENEIKKLKEEDDKRQKREQKLVNKLSVATNQISILQNQVKARSKEVNRHRRTLEIQAKEQNEVIAFLVTSIQHVKQSIAERQLQDLQNNPEQLSSSKPIKVVGNGLKSKLFQAGGGRVDVAQLTWEEREHILRMLLAQVNAQKQISRSASSVASHEDNDGDTKEDPSMIPPPGTAILVDDTDHDDADKDTFEIRSDHILEENKTGVEVKGLSQSDEGSGGWVHVTDDKEEDNDAC